MTTEDIKTMKEQLIKMNDAILRIEEAKSLSVLPYAEDIRILKDTRFVISTVMDVEDMRKRSGL
jgi:hypothetical protein